MTEDEIFSLYYHDLDDKNHKTIWIKKFKELEEKSGENHIIENLGLTTIVKKRDIRDKYTHIFLTINPPPSMQLMDFHNNIEKTLTKGGNLKLWIKGYLYVLEQRGENIEELGKGFHTHILIELTGHKKKSEIDRELKNKWKKNLDTENYHIFNIKYIDYDEQLRKQKYMLAWKKDKKKHLKQEHDILWRQNNSLRKYYFVDYNIEHPECQKDIANVPEDLIQDVGLQEHAAI